MLYLTKALHDVGAFQNEDSKTQEKNVYFFAQVWLRMNSSAKCDWIKMDIT